MVFGSDGLVASSFLTAWPQLLQLLDLQTLAAVCAEAAGNSNKVNASTNVISILSPDHNEGSPTCRLLLTTDKPHYQFIPNCLGCWCGCEVLDSPFALGGSSATRTKPRVRGETLRTFRCRSSE